MFILPAVILGGFLLLAAGYLAYDTVSQSRDTLLARVRENPADYVHARLNEEAPHQFNLNRKVTEAQGALAEAQAKVSGLAQELPTDPLKRKWVVTILAFTGMWATAYVVQFLLDFRIAQAITGNTVAAALISFLVSGLLSAITLAGALLWERRTSLTRRRVVLGVLAAAACLCAVISVIVTLAPKRAELDYAASIATAQQQHTMFIEDGDKTAAALTQTEIDRLEKQRDQAKTFYQAAAVAAGLLEGGASLAVPSGYLLINYYGAQGLVRRRTQGVTKAQNNVARRREMFAARMARTLERAGVPQDRLATFMTRSGPAAAAPATELGAAPVTRDESPTPPSAHAPPQSGGVNEPPDDPPDADEGPDPSFDQA